MLSAIASKQPANGISAVAIAVADQSMFTLRAAIAAGWIDWARAAADLDLRSLYSRPDFQQLVFDRLFPRDAFAR